MPVRHPHESNVLYKSDVTQVPAVFTAAGVNTAAVWTRSECCTSVFNRSFEWREGRFERLCSLSSMILQYRIQGMYEVL